ncbi:hypothetical protein Hdeb2414_s0008g00290071 [Helianthus debilis subsp. tardiflorus]
MPVGGYKDLDLSKRLKTLSFPVMKFLELRTKVGNRKGGIIIGGKGAVKLLAFLVFTHAC